MYEGFEDACGDAPCAWDVAVGRVAVVATLHEGEHGVELAPGSRIARAVSGFADATPQHQIEALVRCDAGGQVRFVIEMASPDEPVRELVVVTASSARRAERFAVIEAVFTESDTTPNRGGTAQGVRVENIGSGTCVVDEVFFLNGPDFSCNG